MPEVDILLKAQDQATAAINKLNDTIDRTTVKSANLADGFADIAGMLQVAERAAGLAGKAFDATVGATVNYANEVRGLQQVTGASAEETSRLIQVLDDYKVSTDAAMLAQKSLTKDGIVLTTDSLADLSEEYLKISDQAERNAFAQDKLGRSYADFIEILQKGPDAIRAASSAVEDGLILTDEATAQAREYEMQMDALSDSFLAFKMKAGKDALPFVMTALNNFTAAVEKSGLAMAIFSFGFDDIYKIATTGSKSTFTAGAGTRAKPTAPQLGIMHGHASGGSFLIPQSYGNEGFRMGNGDTASAGERVTVTPPGSMSSGGIDYNRLARVIRDAIMQVSR